MPKNANYLSHDSQNALLEAGARCVLQQIQKEVEASGMFAIITDCCTDMVADNLSLSVRYVNMEIGEVNERFIEFQELSHTELDARSITDKILTILNQPGRFDVDIKIVLDKHRMVLQSCLENQMVFNGCSEMKREFLCFCPLLCPPVKFSTFCGCYRITVC